MHDRIKQARAHAGLTQGQFAEQLGLSRNYIAMIEIGRREPSDRTISDICRVFSVSEAWLRHGEGEMLVQRSANDQLAILVNDLMAESSETFRRRFLTALLSLPPESWSAVEQFLQSLQQSGNPPESSEKETAQGQ